MGNSAATAAPTQLDPIVTPCPPLFHQFHVDAFKRSVLEGAPMRPAYDAGKDAPAPKVGGEDYWQASGCHPTTLCMLADWLTIAPRTKEKLVVRKAKPEADEGKRTLLAWAKALWDPTGNSSSTIYKSATEHPPWVPHEKDPKREAWQVAHDTIMKGMNIVEHDGKPLLGKRESIRDPALTATVKRDKLAAALRDYGPLPLNIGIPEHYVLLYGVRGDYFYILDPGHCIQKHWAAPHPAMPKGAGDSGYAIVPSGGDPANPLLRMMPHSFNCHVIIDVMRVFPKVALPKKKKDDEETYASKRFIDTLYSYEYFAFEGQDPYNEFLTAPAPDGRASRQTAGPAPAPAPAPAATPADDPAPPPPDAAPKSAPPSAQPAPEATNFFEGFFDYVKTFSFISTAEAAEPPPRKKALAPEKPPADAKAKRPAKAPAPLRFKIRVDVVDADTGAAVDDASVTLVAPKQSGRTKAGAGWTSTPMLPGTYTTRIVARGHGPDYGDRRSSEVAAVDVAVEVVDADVKVVVKLVSLARARAFIHVVETPGRRVLRDVAIQVGKAFKGKSDESGLCVTGEIDPGPSNVQAVLAGYGAEPPKGSATREGAVSLDATFPAGHKVLLLQMRRVAPTRPPYVRSGVLDRTKLALSAKSSGGGLLHEIDHSVVSIADVDYTFTHSAPKSETPGTWTLFDPDGNVVMTKTQPLRVTELSVNSRLLSAKATTPDSHAFGEWTVRLETVDFYDDYAFTYAAPIPYSVDDPGIPPPIETAYPKVTSSKLYVDGKHFVTWYNDVYRTRYAGELGQHATLDVHGSAAHLCGTALNVDSFNRIFDHCADLWSAELEFNEFVFLLNIMLMEVQGELIPVAERGPKGDLREKLTYFFEARTNAKGERIKASYNGGGNRKAGDQLLARKVISTPADVATWNGAVFPADCPDTMLDAVAECDFYKFRGRGYVQITFHQQYLTQVDPHLIAAGYKKSDELTGAELTKAVLDEITVNLRMTRSFLQSKAVIRNLKGTLSFRSAAGGVNAGATYQAVIDWQCRGMLHALEGLRIELKAGA